jgi:hypothetical protein
VNLINAVQRLLPTAAADDVGQLFAAVPKPDALECAERALSEALATIASSTRRQGMIHERLTVQNPTKAPVVAAEEEALDAENRELTARVAALQSKVVQLKAEIQHQMPAYVQLVSSALAPQRKRAAQQLASGIAAIETALNDIDASNRILRGLGRQVPSVMQMPMAQTYRALAAKVAREGQS